MRMFLIVLPLVIPLVILEVAIWNLGMGGACYHLTFSIVYF